MKKYLFLFAGLCCSFALATANQAPENFPEISSWEMHLENIDVLALKNSKADVLVLDYSHNGQDSGQLTRQEITLLQKEGKTVLAYISIPAEIWRFYWQSEWEITSSEEPCYETYLKKFAHEFDWRRCADNRPPSWLGSKDQVSGKYLVKYWQSTYWDEVMQPYLQRVAIAGFDGIVLDIDTVPTKWAKSDQVSYSLSILNQHMAKLLTRVRHEGMRISQQVHFFIVPYNTLQIVDTMSSEEKENMMKNIDAIVIRDFFFHSSQKIRFGMWQRMKYFWQAQKPILSVEFIAADQKKSYLRQRNELANWEEIIPFAVVE